MVVQFYGRILEMRNKRYLDIEDKNYLRKETTFKNHSYVYFSKIENDFILLFKPLLPTIRLMP